MQLILWPPQSVSVSVNPLEFVYGGANTQVTQDTANASNNRALPSLITYIKDGVQVPVLEDTVTPANNKPLPVKLTGVTGDAGTPHIVQGVQVLGSDGTNNVRLKTDAAGELQVDVLTSALPTGASTLAEQQTQTTALSAIQTAVQLIDNSANVDGTPIGTAGLAIGGRDGSGNFQQVSVNTAGELSVTFGSAGFATETTLSALNTKVANNYGAATGAVRTAAQVGNAGGAADFNSGADSAQTLRVSANLKRAGNELSYNSGAADANTVRNVLATRHEDATTPLATRLADGTDFISAVALAASRLSIASATKILATSAVMVGWDGTNHRELSITTAGRLETEQVSKDGSITNAQVTVGLTAVRATVSGAAPANSRRLLRIKPSKNNTGAIYYGSSSVTTANGMEIIGPDTVEFLNDHSDWYLISDTAAQVVEIVEV